MSWGHWNVDQDSLSQLWHTLRSPKVPYSYNIGTEMLFVYIKSSTFFLKSTFFITTINNLLSSDVWLHVVAAQVKSGASHGCTCQAVSPLLGKLEDEACWTLGRSLGQNWIGRSLVGPRRWRLDGFEESLVHHRWLRKGKQWNIKTERCGWCCWAEGYFEDLLNVLSSEEAEKEVDSLCGWGCWGVQKVPRWLNRGGGGWDLQ